MTPEANPGPSRESRSVLQRSECASRGYWLVGPALMVLDCDYPRVTLPRERDRDLVLRVARANGDKVRTGMPTNGCRAWASHARATSVSHGRVPWPFVDRCHARPAPGTVTS
jgi:hypothetical protein